MNMDIEKKPGVSGQTSTDAETEDQKVGETVNNHRRDMDVAAKFLNELDPAILSEPITKEEARKLLWKVDLIMIPLITLSVILSATDKVIISNAAIYGMKKDAHLVGNQYSWVGSIFYFGYLVAEYPPAFLIQRLPVAKFLSVCVLGWGIIMLCTAATHNFAGLAVTRFIMGMLESIVFPVCSILTVMWWTTGEQLMRVAFWFNQVSVN